MKNFEFGHDGDHTIPGFHSAEKFSRRTRLKVGGIGMLDLTLPKLLTAEAACFGNRM